MFSEQLDVEVLDEFRQGVNQCLVTGSERFTDEVETMLEWRVFLRRVEMIDFLLRRRINDTPTPFSARSMVAALGHSLSVHQNMDLHIIT